MLCVLNTIKSSWIARNKLCGNLIQYNIPSRIILRTMECCGVLQNCKIKKGREIILLWGNIKEKENEYELKRDDIYGMGNKEVTIVILLLFKDHRVKEG